MHQHDANTRPPLPADLTGRINGTDAVMSFARQLLTHSEVWGPVANLAKGAPPEFLHAQVGNVLCLLLQRWASDYAPGVNAILKSAHVERYLPAFWHVGAAVVTAIERTPETSVGAVYAELLDAAEADDADRFFAALEPPLRRQFAIAAGGLLDFASALSEQHHEAGHA